MYTTRDKRGHIGVCLTLIFKVNHQGYVIYFGLFEIPDLENVEINTKIKSVACIQPEIFERFCIPDLKNARIDTKIKSVSCLQPEITKVIPVHMYDLDFEGQRRGHVIFYFGLFVISDPENFEIDTKIRTIIT